MVAEVVTPLDSSGDALLFTAQMRNEYSVPGDKLPIDFEVVTDVVVVPAEQFAGAVAPV